MGETPFIPVGNYGFRPAAKQLEEQQERWGRVRDYVV
jgi:hypothetical protein